jgi:TolA-binding protein
VIGALALAAALGAAAGAEPAPASPPPAAEPVAPCRARPAPSAAGAAPGSLAGTTDLEERIASARRFEEEAAGLLAELREVVKLRRDERRRVVSDRYERALRDVEAQERTARDEAIRTFEVFVRRWPDDPRSTPDAMFRLAELLFEEASDEYGQASAAWRAAAAEADAAGREPPPEPTKSYARAIAVYQRLLTGFPAYPRLHAAQYLLAYCLGEMGQIEEAQAAFATLVERFPESPFVPEAWLRMGDYAFDDVRPGALERAAEALAHVEAWPDHPLYPRALYELGWTFYRLDRHGDAIATFAKLLDLYAARARATGAALGGEVWPEAVRYTAIAFADPGPGAAQRARSFFGARRGRAWEREVWVALGDVLFEQARHLEAADAWREALAKGPLAPDAPRLQARIVTAFGKERRFADEARAREDLAAEYGEGGAWAAANRADPELSREVRELVQRSLVAAAAYHHKQAQVFQQAGRLDEAVPAYRAAARDYERYLARFPHARDAYDLAYQWADALYQAGDLPQAAEAYAQVRDDPSGTRWRAEAALAAVLARQGALAAAERAGTVPVRKALTSRERQADPRPTPLEPPVAALVRDADGFVDRLPEHERAPAIAYQAAEAFYAHDQLPEARCRFEEVVARWPAAAVAGFAANLIIESHLAARDWAAVEAASARLQKADVAKNPELAATLQKFKLGGRFNRAMQLMEAKRWDEAAALFVALVAEDPRHEFADKALYNAAACHEGARRFESALRLQERIYAEYPSSAFADEALFRVAWNAENTYDFGKAVERYLLLVEKYPGSKRRKDALYDAARSLENLQRYPEAAEAYGRYAALYPDAEDAPRTLFHAAVVWERAGDRRRQVQALQDFGQKFARSKEHELVVRAHLARGSAERALGDEAAARAAWSRAVEEFARRGLDPSQSPAAAAAAAEARFRLAEVEFERFDAIQLPATTNAKKLKAALEAKLAELKKVAPQYQEVKKYKRPDWTLAAFYRQAFLLERLAQTLYEAPVPPEFQRPGQEEYLAAYQDQLSQFAQPYEDQAVAVYVQALQAARELRVKNEWTRRIAESLARYRPKEYPLLKEAKGRLAAADLAPAWIAETPEGPARREERKIEGGIGATAPKGGAP